MTHPHLLPVLLFLGFSLPAQQEPGAAARDQLSRVLGEQDPSRPATGQGDPLRATIDELDLGHYENQSSPARNAYLELRNLGVLAAPSLYRALNDLGPFGLDAALHLLVEYPDQRMTAALDRLLRSSDTSRQMMAAQIMRQLPIEIVRPLADLARASEVTEVKLAGLAVGARDGMSDAELAAALLPLTDDKARNHRFMILRIIAERPLPGRALLPVLEALMQPCDEDTDPEDPARVAVEDWARRVGDDGEAAAIALFGRLGSVTSRNDLVDALYRNERLPWTGFWMHAASELSQPSNTVVLALAKSPPRDLPDQLLSKLLSSSAGWKQALDLVLRTRRTTLAKDVGAVLLNPRIADDTRGDCFRWLADVAPEYLIENAAAVLRTAFAEEAAVLFASIDDPRTVRPAVERLRELQANRSAFDPLLSVVSYRSTGDQLDAVLDLVSLPLDRTDTTGEWVGGARRALNRWLAPEHLPAVCERLFEIHSDVAEDILHRPALATPEQRAAVTALLRKCLDRWRSPAMYDGPVIATATAGLAAIQMLAHLGGEADVALLFELLEAPQQDARDAAFAALLSMGNGVRKRTLAAALRRDGDPFNALSVRDVGEDPELRRLATERLLARAFVRAGSVGEFLRFCPEDDRAALIEQILRQAEEGAGTAHVDKALAALGELGPGHEAELGKWIHHPAPMIRGVAIEQLGRRFSPEAVPFLLDALEDDYVPNRKLAQEALSRFEAYLTERARWKTLLQGDRDKQPKQSK